MQAKDAGRHLSEGLHPFVGCYSWLRGICSDCYRSHPCAVPCCSMVCHISLPAISPCFRLLSSDAKVSVDCASNGIASKKMKDGCRMAYSNIGTHEHQWSAWHRPEELTVLCRYYMLVLAVITPFFAIANTYGAGLTDFDMSPVYGTVRSFCSSSHCKY